MSSAPPPAVLTLLSQLPTHETGTKVRFLGCVQNYDAKTATVTLEHNVCNAHEPQVTARVDVKIVLESCERMDLDVGAWINVIGYTQGVMRGGRDTQTRRQEAAESDLARSIVCVQAIMLWNAGAIKIDEYERAVRKKTELAGYSER